MVAGSNPAGGIVEGGPWGGACSPQDEDADPDERITFTLTERWSEYPVGDAQQREGIYLCTYSYQRETYERLCELRGAVDEHDRLQAEAEAYERAL